MAIDRRELLQVLNFPADLHLTDVPFTPRQYHRGTIPPALEYAPDSARAMLAEAGWRDTDGDGVLNRDGQRFRFSTLLTSPGEEASAVYIQAVLRRVGVDMRIDRLDPAVVRRRIGVGDFEAAFSPLWNAVEGYTRAFAISIGEGSGTGKAVANPIGYSNDRVSQLLTDVALIADPEVRDSIFRMLAPLIAADMPITFLFPDVQATVAHRRVHGLESPFVADPVMVMERLRIEERR